MQGKGASIRWGSGGIKEINLLAHGALGPCDAWFAWLHRVLETHRLSELPE